MSVGRLLEVCGLLTVVFGALGWCFGDAWDAFWSRQVEADTASLPRGGVAACPPAAAAPHVRKIPRPYDWELDA